MREKVTLFVPTIETVQDKNAFIVEEPLESLMSGRFNKVPIIVGVNEEEGILSSSSNHISKMFPLIYEEIVSLICIIFFII